jgi:hypothetical protein
MSPLILRLAASAGFDLLPLTRRRPAVGAYRPVLVGSRKTPDAGCFGGGPISRCLPAWPVRQPEQACRSSPARLPARS